MSLTEMSKNMSGDKSDDIFSSSENKIPKFPKDREYFKPWVQRMKLFLNIRGYWQVTSKSIQAIMDELTSTTNTNNNNNNNNKNTGSSTPSTTTSSSSSSSKGTLDELKEKLTMQSMRAYYIIMQSLHYSQYTIVASVESDNAYELWKKINEVYGVVKTSETHASILSKIITIEKQRKETMIEYISTIKKLISELELINDSKISSMDEKFYILNGLRNITEWQVDVKIIKKLDVDNSWTVKKIEDYLLAEESNKKLKKGEEEAHYTHDKYKQKGKFNKYKNNYTNNNNKYNNNNNNNSNNSKHDDKSICRNYAKTGECKFGDKCKYKHVKNDNNKNNNNNNHKNNNDDKEVCKYYEKTGECKYGDKCKFKHVKNNNNNNKNDKKAYSTSDNNNNNSSEYDSEDCFMVTNEYVCVTNTNDNNTNPNINNNNKNTWILDSAATSHFACNKKLLYDLRQLDTPIKIKTASGTIESNTVGSANIVNENGEIAVILQNVIYVPTFGVNLISSRKFTSKGCTITENKNEAVIYRPNNGGILLKAITNNNLYRVQAYYDDIVSDENINNNNKNNNDKINNSEKEVIQKLQQLHILYGHLSYTTLYQLIKNKCIDDINIDKSIINDKIIKTLQQQECKACIKGKFKRLPMISKIEYNVNDKMDMWVADLMGPVRVETIGDIQYILVVCDVHEKYIFMKGVKDKTEATTALINIIKQQQIQTGKKLKTLHTDNGGEFISGTLTEYLVDNGITITYTTPHTPQHNAIAERMIQTIMNTTRCMMIQAQAPACMWALAVKCAAYILNRRMSTVNNNKTISESWHDKKVKINNMHTWGCDAYYYKHKVERDSKVDDRAEEGIFVGYDIDNDSYYYIYNTNTDKIIKTRDVRMYDNKFNNMKKLYDSENDNNNSNSDGSDIVSAGDDYIDERYSTTQIEEMFKQLEQSIHNKIK